MLRTKKQTSDPSIWPRCEKPNENQSVSSVNASSTLNSTSFFGQSINHVNLTLWWSNTKVCNLVFGSPFFRLVFRNHKCIIDAQDDDAASINKVGVNEIAGNTAVKVNMKHKKYINGFGCNGSSTHLPMVVCMTFMWKKVGHVFGGAIYILYSYLWQKRDINSLLLVL